MNNFLAIDTSSGYFSITIHYNGKFFNSHLTDCAMRHSVILMDEVDRVLKEANASLDEMDFFSAVVGAGSFTGIRIGISAIKGFCLATGKPSIPVTSFELAAYNALDGEKPLCLIDALHGYYYVCGFDENKNIIYSPAYLKEEDVIKVAEENNFKLYSLEVLPINQKKDVTLINPLEGLIKAVSINIEKGKIGPLEALYIRKSQAEENLSKKV